MPMEYNKDKEMIFSDIADLEENEILSDDDLDRLREYAKNTDPEIRLDVAELLASFPSDKSEELLLSMLKDKNRLVKATVCDALSFSDSTETLNKIKVLTNDKSCLVRGYAILSITDIQQNIKPPYDETIKFLSCKYDSESSEWVRLAVSHSMHILGEYKHEGVILEGINSKYYRNRCFTLNLIEAELDHYITTVPNLLFLLRKRLLEEKSIAVKGTLQKVINNICVNQNRHILNPP